MEASHFYLIVIFILTLLLQHFIPSYLKEKGKNLATTEDIDKITKKIESVKLEYFRQLEDYKNELNNKSEFNKLKIDNKKFLYS